MTQGAFPTFFHHTDDEASPHILVLVIPPSCSTPRVSRCQVLFIQLIKGPRIDILKILAGGNVCLRRRRGISFLFSPSLGQTFRIGYGTLYPRAFLNLTTQLLDDHLFFPGKRPASTLRSRVLRSPSLRSNNVHLLS